MPLEGRPPAQEWWAAPDPAVPVRASRPPRSCDALALARRAVDDDPRSISEHGEPTGAADPRRQPILARDDGGVREQPAPVGHDRAEERQHDVEGRRRRVRDEDVAPLDATDLLGAANHPCGALVHARADAETVN